MQRVIYKKSHDLEKVVDIPLLSYQPHDPKALLKFVRKEVQLLRSNLPKGIFVKTFEDRMDLFSVMIVGPEMTPYQDGLFFFDLQLSPGIFPL